MKDTQAIFSAMLENKKASAKSQARKVESIKRLKKESEEAPVEFEGTLLKAQAGEEDVMDDVLDNIQVVTDPEKTVDELEKRADAVQDAIDGSPAGEEAFSDEYVGDKVYACPVCGESFFAEEDYNEGDACPICKAEPTDGFLLQGVVAPVNEEPEVEEPESEGEVEDEETPAEGIDEFDDEDTTDDDGESVNESVKPGTLSADIKGYKNAILNKLVKRNAALKDEYAAKVADTLQADYSKLHDAGIAPEDIEAAFMNKDSIEVKDAANNSYEIRIMANMKKENKAVKECDEPEVDTGIEVTIKLDDEEIEVTKPAELDVEIDEASFEDTLNQFAEENYSDSIDEIKVTDASYDAAEDELCLDCVAECKNGKKVPMQFKMKESKCKGNRALLLARECKGALKVESKAPAFSFQVRNENKVIRCESFKYNFTTTHSTAGRVKVEGYCRAKKVRV